MSEHKVLGLTECWAIALTDDVALRGRAVWSRPSEWFGRELDELPFEMAGILSGEIDEDTFWREVEEAQSK